MDTHLDRIHIRDLLLRCIIGINDAERSNKQDVIINIEIWANLRRAAATDRIDQTVNYRTLTKQIIQHVENSSYFLVETLAERVAEICLQERGVEQVEVTIEKPGALRFARSVGVTLVRQRGERE